MRTVVEMKTDLYQLKKGDKGYIDGYVQGCNGQPCGVFVRLSDGIIELAPVHYLKWIRVASKAAYISKSII